MSNGLYPSILSDNTFLVEKTTSPVNCSAAGLDGESSKFISIG